MNIVRLEPWHIEAFAPRPEDDYDFIYERLEEVVFRNPLPEVQAWAAISDTRDVGGLGGVFPLWKGVAEGIILLSERPIPTTWMTFLIRNKLREIMRSGNLKRIQTTVRADHPERTTWLSLMGFKIEGIMYQYGPDGCNHYMMAKVL